MNHLIRSITVPKYIKHVVLSKKRRAKYYTKKSKIPKKYQGLPFNNKGILVDKLGNPVIANPRVVGTPRLKKINGQDFYKGTDSPHIRSKVVNEIKSFLKPFVKGIESIEEYPVQIKLQLHDVVGAGNWDLDNLWIYNKCMQDVLVDEGVLAEDNVMYVTAAAAPEFYPVENEEDRKLVFLIYKDERDVIADNPLYNELHSNSSEW
jgi:hypothetical protein